MSLHQRRKFHSLIAVAAAPVVFASFFVPTANGVGGTEEDSHSYLAVQTTTAQQDGTSTEEKTTDETRTREENESSLPESVEEEAASAKDNAHSDSSSSMVKASLTRIDTLGDKAKVGETVKFRFTFRNMSKRPVTVYPYESTLHDVVVGQTPARNCRWFGLRPGKERSCDFGYHVLNEKDVTTPFIPTITYKLTEDRAGTRVLDGQTKIVVSAQPITAVPTPDLELSSLEDGQAATLARTINRNKVCYRIPALTTANNGDVLAAWDYRPGGCGDSPNPNSIALRVWKKGTDSFTQERIIAQGVRGKQKKGYSDPSFVVDRETGDIFMFSVLSYDAGLNQSRPGVGPHDRRVIHANLMVSHDNGQTWEDRGIITRHITNASSWRARFASSGEGIQIKNGPYAGRLIQQYAVHTDVSPRFQAVSIYSDDHGTTWKAGNPVGTNMDENKVVELADGTLMLNSRISSGAVKGRKISYSTDGGVNWSAPVDDTNLIDPHNNASIIRAFPEAHETDSRSKILLFSNANSRTGRHNGTIRVSVDNGASWSQGKLFSGKASDQMQYSTMTKISDGVFGILYEAAGPSIAFAKFSTPWLGKFVHYVCAEGEGCPTSQFIENDGVSVEPVAPTREGYTFKGWTEGKKPYTFGQKVEGEVILEATWEKDVAPAPTPEPKDEVTPEPKDEVTPEPKDEVTPEPKDEVTPEPKDDVTPQPEEDVTPVLFPSVTPKRAHTFVFGDKEVTYGRPGDKPIVGDWDGDGIATPGVIRGNRVYLSNTLKGGNADIVFVYGRVGDTPIVGDWNGDGTQTLALRRGNTVYVKNTLSGGYADKAFTYGRVGDEVFVGDWNGDGRDTLALRRGTTIYQSNSLDGQVDKSFILGREGDIAIAGRFSTKQKVDTISFIRDGQLHIITSSGTDERTQPLPQASTYLVASTGKDSADTVVPYGARR